MHPEEDADFCLNAYLTGFDSGAGGPNTITMLRKGGIRVVDAIVSAGYECIPSTNTKNIQADPEEIDTDPITGCDVVVVDLSGKLNDEVVSWELGFACGKGIPVIAVQPKAPGVLVREASFGCYIEHVVHTLSDLQMLLLELQVQSSDTASSGSGI
eukprot:CAMPEP_0206429562 /NCGR_PEP_ID=MMETSP0324_2-20121206/6314_1 /ASSEMBLY_ACC=CAM_ASM_000836 /TAXON_ID=2866 /ORGANISM="Crypthecodinium cohnii, Strain Seligo" /LENGTH=155 /DNA_ID=CAMNT_0053895265 /DNA_START=70 /DNA_END=537 /DNA_ORIENTATION=-